MPYTSGHPEDWTLELLAEGVLPPNEQASVAAHVAQCPECAAEVEGYRALFTALSSLPRYEPSPMFADAVMARVQVAPQAAPGWLARWLPSTRRGWFFLVALSMVPALPVVALLAWVFAQPGLSPLALWEWGTIWARDAGWSLSTRMVATAVDSGILVYGSLLLDWVQGIPLGAIAGGALLFALGIPLSAWTLYRSLRTPMGGTVYAH